MEEVLNFLRTSLSDEVLSRQERRDLKQLLTQHALTPEEIGAVRSKVFELAAGKMQGGHVDFIMEWMKSSLNALTVAPESSAAYFSPGESCRKAILQEVQQATQLLQVCVFTISDDAIARALLGAHRKGVQVNIITDNDKSFDEGSDVATLSREGLVVRMDTSPNHMHHKFMVADGATLITGSYNWTNSAARFNQENIIVTREAALVGTFAREFERLWPLMAPFK